MTTVRQACRHIRSKNAGPFWVTIDLFFDGERNFKKYAESPALGPEALARLYGADASLVKRYAVPSLHMVKVSYPRANAQGGEVERDMHCGQQFVRLLDVELD
ncbi:MAG: DUF4387 domain-containing protein [Alphaproteobacteria bacterium]|nr:MAG: DUF4387 domain-containing protein [Alphaproteobacteria bacterium]